MFWYNLKINSKRIAKFIFILMLIAILIIFSIAFYKVFFNEEKEQTENDTITLEDTVKGDDLFEITNENYTTILQAVNDNIDDYIGCKIHFVGYVYRLIDFDETEFVLARDMLINKNTNQSVVVGFLCSYDRATNFTNDTWVDVTGTITKGDYYGDIAKLQIDTISQCNEPENKYVSEPDDTYVPTSAIL